MADFIARVNSEVVTLPYVLGYSPRLKREVIFHPEWCRMIQENATTILGWIQFNKLKWLQSNNPELPGLPFKLAPLDDSMRKLGHVRALWDGAMELMQVRDVFDDRPLQKGGYDVDHFIPWSFVMCDELWNLMPMDSSDNSSKSNRLPQWEPFFPRFAENQFALYQLVNSKEFHP